MQDDNSAFLCKELRSLGCSVMKVCVVPDEVYTIAAEVKRMQAQFDIVVTAGGTGPTLDDVTISGIAIALDKRLTRHSTLEQRLQQFYGGQLTHAHLKMAQVGGAKWKLNFPSFMNAAGGGRP